MKCKSFGCNHESHQFGDFCAQCSGLVAAPPTSTTSSLADKYPQYYKKVGDMEEVDVYAVHYLFNIQDPSGAIQHASKKLLLSGVRTGNKSKFKDVREARDTLTRWLEINIEQSNAH